MDYKVLLYNSTLKSLWTNGSQLWGNASSRNRNSTASTIDTPNQNIPRDFGILAVRDEIDKQKALYNKKNLWAPKSSRKRLGSDFHPTTRRPPNSAIHFWAP